MAPGAADDALDAPFRGARQPSCGTIENVETRLGLAAEPGLAS